MIPSLDRQVVFGIFRSRFSAEDCFISLLGSGYLSSDVNLLMTDETRARDYAWSRDDAFARNNESVVGSEGGGFTTEGNPDRTVRAMATRLAAEDIGTGSVVGATLEAIAAVGTSIDFPDLHLIVAGPMTTSIVEAVPGDIQEDFPGFLVRLGIPQHDARVFRNALVEGGILLSVTVQREDVHEIQNLMAKNLGEHISYYTF